MALEKMTSRLVPDIERYLRRHRAGVEATVASAGEDAGLPSAVALSKVYDGLLSVLFHAARAALEREGGGAWHPVSLAAVGSYGRGALAVHSDLDVRLLCARDAQAAHRVAETLLYPLWDAGISIGHQVVTPDESIELARTDLPTATTLLDWRPLAGSGSTVDAELLARAREGVFGSGSLRRFLESLSERRASAKERFGGTVYLLEPDVRNGPGGFRDLDIVHWAARARWSTRDLSDLVRVGALVPREWRVLDEARRLLWRMRNLMHLRAGRRADRLTFEVQEHLAAVLGYGSDGAATERLMSDYYRHAREVQNAAELVLARATPPSQRRPVEEELGEGLKTMNGQVSFLADASLDASPALALRLYEVAVSRGQPVYEYARDAVRRATRDEAFCERLRASPDAARAFTRLVGSARSSQLRGGSIVRELHEVGLLLAMVPEFAPVIGRVHHDIYHVLTVDAHSIAALDCLHALRRGDLVCEFPLASWLAAELARPSVLAFAVLLHDVGKDIGGKSHSERGAELAATILARLGMPSEDAADVVHLIRNHLAMYHVATRRDVDDPRTIVDFRPVAQSREGLRELYLLTVADISTTSPTALTTWKSRMLEELFVATDRSFAGAESTRDDAAAKARRAAVVERAEARVAGRLEPEFVAEFLRAIPDRYLYANTPEWIVEHIALAARASGDVARVEHLQTIDSYVELWVVADDQPGLLAKIAATFAAARLKVLGAQIYTWKLADGRQRALDGFWVSGRGEASEVLRVVPQLEQELKALVSGTLTAEELLGRRRPSAWTGQRVPDVASRVSVDNRAATDHTVIEVIGPDRPGLLYSLAHALQAEALDIALAKINTEGARIADVFYVADERGAKVTDPARVRAVEERLLAAVREAAAR